jgi:hypothetical protein
MSAEVQSFNENDAFSMLDGVSTSEDDNPGSGGKVSTGSDVPADLLIDATDSDINFEHDATVVSDMDVLVIESQDEQMTGDDVAGKIQEIIEKTGPVEEITSSLIDKRVADNGEDAFGQLLADTADYSVTQSSEQGALFDELTIVEDRTLPASGEQRADTDNQNDSLLHSENLVDTDDRMPDSIDTGDHFAKTNTTQRGTVVSGSDIEDRIDEFFGTDVLETVRKDLVPDDDEMEETIIQDFYTVTGENTATASGNENLEGVDKVEIDNDAVFVEESSEPVVEHGEGDSTVVEEVPHFRAASLFEEEREQKSNVVSPAGDVSDESIGMYPADQRDKPYEIPDHVLTPTLADIYYQQGQYTLAHQIYSRLLEKEPENDKLRSRLDEIQEEMKYEHLDGVQIRQVDSSDITRSEINKIGVRKTESLQSDSRPLAGVRIPKKKGVRKKNSKKKIS